jgi:plastocyanin
MQTSSFRAWLQLWAPVLFFLPGSAAGDVTATPAALGRQAPGHLEGSVVVGTRLPAPRSRVRLYTQHNPRQPLPTAERSNDYENVVVYLVSVPEGSYDPRPPSVRPSIAQFQERFVPHVLPVVKGTEVEFPNRDPLFHNVFSLSKAASFDLGRYPQPGSKSVRFDEPGVVPLFCHIHADMSAVVLVLENPFFTKPDAEGRFRIEGIPPGRYDVVAWHERARSALEVAEVLPGKTSIVDFALPVDRLDSR